MMRNRRRDRMMLEQGISEEERIKRGKEMGEQDCTDFQNVYVRVLLFLTSSFVSAYRANLTSFDTPCER